ncbi:MAG: thiamine pyrophosphate-requiring protein [Ectothiorhodospiraceae bacterium]|nr:thiamine pyrophosphate-requiring protein [Chromatiales bacterium]MCP5157498.1 thiamine pyrophosphate-requiring protein [Ectothiorhodospiraceae bacterium]
MARRRIPVRTVAEAWLAALKARGVDYLFANAGTDFAPVIEALVRGARDGIPMPEPVTCAHETAAVAMAHGHYLATGRPQAVMVHVNVGTANALMGLLNASRDQIPMLFTAGRTPITEHGRLGSRDLPIHWGQEMFDQAGMLRESVRWDYELRYPEQVEAVVDRAIARATGAPAGPVYVGLPREILAEPIDGLTLWEPTRLAAPTPPSPDPAAVERTADALAAASTPLVLTARSGREPGAFDALGALAERFALPVVEFWPSQSSLSSEHPMHAGHDPAPWLESADVVVVLDALVPWIPSRTGPRPDCLVVQTGTDPSFGDLPMRSFPADLAVTTTSAAFIGALHRALETRLPAGDARVETRRQGLAPRLATARRARREAAADATAPMTNAYVSRCIDAVKGDDALVFAELGCDVSVMRFPRSGTFFSHSLAGGLGWGLPAALGAQLADRDRLVIACVGDGSYLFANPLACHQAAEALGLPVLTVVFDNARWDAVRKSTLAVYPDGEAAHANRLPLVSLAPAPRYAEAVAACGGHGERVEDPTALPEALARAVRVVREERRQALVDVICR